MRSVLRVMVVVAAIALVVVIIQQHQAGKAREGWARFAEAHDQGMTVASLETARDQAANSPARPWLDFELAYKLYEQGTPADLERALQITRESLASNGDHPAAGALRKLDSTLRTYLPQSSPAGGTGG